MQSQPMLTCLNGSEGLRRATTGWVQARPTGVEGILKRGGTTWDSMGKEAQGEGRRWGRRLAWPFSGSHSVLGVRCWTVADWLECFFRLQLLRRSSWGNMDRLGTGTGTRRIWTAMLKFEYHGPMDAEKHVLSLEVRLSMSGCPDSVFELVVLDILMKPVKDLLIRPVAGSNA